MLLCVLTFMLTPTPLNDLNGGVQNGLLNPLFCWYSEQF
jgi:hypothetical protein